MSKEPLLDRTKRLLSERSESLEVIAERSGVGHSWLSKFAADRIPKPGVLLVQQLHDYLSTHRAA